MKRLKTWHLGCILIGVVLALMVLHYFSHHKGQSPIKAYTPMGLVSK